MEGDHLSLDFTIFNLDFIPSEDDGDIFTDTRQIPMPIRYIFVGDAGCHVEHDDGALSLDVVSVAESSEFLLSCGIPYVEFDRAAVGVECERVDFDTEGGDVFLFEFAG